jgi:hypothetical protein
VARKSTEDRHEGHGGDDEVEGQRGQHAAVVEPGQEHDRQDDEGLGVQPLVARHGRDRLHEEAHVMALPASSIV